MADFVKFEVRIPAEYGRQLDNAADQLGISRNTLVSSLIRFSLDDPAYLSVLVRRALKVL